MAIHSDKSSDKGPENRIEKILPSTSKVLKDSLEEIEIVRRISDAETIQRISNEKDRAYQKSRELKKSTSNSVTNYLEVRARRRRMKKTRLE